MKSRSGKEIVINDIYEFECFSNENYQGFKLGWDSTIGYGEMTFVKEVGSEDWKVETEAMSDNTDKEFIKLVLDKFIEKLDVIE